MRKKFLNILCCPETGSGLELEVEELFDNNPEHIKSGSLVSRDRNHIYPIINGVPRFVGKEHYAKSFGYEWKRWSKVQFEAENIGLPMEGYTGKMFEKITQFSNDEINNKLVIDFGCGPGRFLDMVRTKGGIAVGMDLSAAVDVAFEIFKDDDNVLIVQGDILHPPFFPDTFDLAYSIGVFHHTPDPPGCLESLVHIAKVNSKISVCVYPKNIWYDYPVLKRFRKFFNFIRKYFGSAFSNTAALYYSRFSAYVITPVFYRLFRFKRLRKFLLWLDKNLIVILSIPDKRWRILDIFDAITPFYASTHSEEEIINWFEKSNCREIKKTDWGASAFTAVKN
jgi:SAM-dependent methyltransferase